MACKDTSVVPKVGYMVMFGTDNGYFILHYDVKYLGPVKGADTEAMFLLEHRGAERMNPKLTDQDMPLMFEFAACRVPPIAMLQSELFASEKAVSKKVILLSMQCSPFVSCKCRHLPLSPGR